MAKQTKPRLGRGLSSLIGQPVEVAPPAPKHNQTYTEHLSAARAPNEDGDASLRIVSVVAIVPSPYQPRIDFADADLESLAASIKTSGVMQPVAVRPIPQRDPRYHTGAHFELIAGERRWRAAQLADLDTVPALVADLSDQESAEWALVENIQRADLSPIERAAALRRLTETFKLSHAALAERIGLDRSTVSNLIRLNELEDEIKQLVASTLSAGHAKALLAIPPGKHRIRIARLAAKNAWSVRKLEEIAASTHPHDRTALPTISTTPNPQVANIEKQLSDHLATRVRLRTDPAGKKGRIIIDFYSLEHFDGLIKTLGLDLES